MIDLLRKIREKSNRMLKVGKNDPNEKIHRIELQVLDIS